MVRAQSRSQALSEPERLTVSGLRFTPMHPTSPKALPRMMPMIKSYGKPRGFSWVNVTGFVIYFVIFVGNRG